MKHLFFVCALSLAAVGASTFAQEVPAITVSKGDKLQIAIGKMDGPEGAAAAKTLANDLALSGYFSVVPAGKAQFVVSGTAGGASLNGRVAEANGNTALSETFTGAGKSKVHKFADQIVETLTGNKGIASTKIAFVATRSGKKEIYTADIDGSNVVQLTKDNSIAVAPSLSPDGRRLVYTGYQSGYADVYEIDLGSGSRQRIIKYPGTNSGAAFSPDGGRLALTLSKDGNPEIYVTGAGGGGARRITRTPAVESSPTWSPNGDELIYSSDAGGSPKLYRVSSGGGSPHMISTGHGYNTEPSWSPDGKKVAYTVRSGGSFQVAITNLEGGGGRVVGDGQDPVWGADSRHLLLASGGSIILLDTQTGSRTALISGLGRASEPTWSR